MSGLPAALFASRLLARALIVWALLAALPGAASAAAAPAVQGASGAEAIDRLVADACGKSLVLLGEDLHHGSGASVDAKAAVAQRLIDRCGFTAVLFEGQVYDFLAMQRAFREGHATRRMLSDTIGGLWSPTADFQPFEDFLFDRARRGRLFLGGIDPQLGGATQQYSPGQLAPDLARPLTEPMKSTCEARISRLANWGFDDASPYDDSVRAGIRECLAAVASAIGEHGPDARGAEGEVAFMAANLGAYLDMSDAGAGRRDRAMADNVLWYLQQLPRGTRAIVWTASVHAAKAEIPGGDGQGEREPMGDWLRGALGGRVAAFAFVATSGTYGSHGRGPFPIPPASPALLESGDAPAVGASHDDGVRREGMRYLDRQRLAAIGASSSRALDYAHVRILDWATLFDGILVLREEHPMRAIESPSASLPRQRRESR